jgi:hypothetical protein
LAIGVDDEDALSFLMKSRAEMHGDRAFSYPALLLSYRDDFRCQFFRSLTDRRILPRKF